MTDLSVTLTIDKNDLFNVAQMAIDTLYEDFGEDIVNAAGVDDSELIQAIVADKTFRAMMTKIVERCGFDAVECPYDYIDGYDMLETIPGLCRLVDMIKDVEEIAHEEDEDVTCVPVPAGYKLVKI